MNIFQFLGQYMSILWRFFRIPFPATNVPIGAILFLPLVIDLAIKFLSNIMGSGGAGQISGFVKDSSSTAKVDRLNARQTEREARRFVK